MAAPNRIQTVPKGKDAHHRCLDTLRLIGLAAVNGNQQARGVLVEFTKLTGEPRYAEAAAKFLAHADGAA